MTKSLPAPFILVKESCMTAKLGGLCGCTRGRTKSPTRLARSGELPFSAICLTMALPTTTASACLATACACSGVEIPNPTAIGSDVCCEARRLARKWCLRQPALLTGHSFTGDVVDKTLAGRDYLRHALRRGGRSDQANEIETARGNELGILLRLVGRKIQNQQPICTGRGRIGKKTLEPVGVDGIQVSEKNERKLRIRPEAPNDFDEPETVIPAASARLEAAWIVGPSARGSENGMPSSKISTPADSRA